MSDEMALVLIDKGLLALVALAVGYLLARSLEHLKTSLTLGAEITKQRIDAAKRTLACANELRAIHLNAVGSYITEVFHSGQKAADFDPRNILESCEALRELRLELTILQASDKVLNGLNDLMAIATDAIGAKPPGAAGTIYLDTDGESRLVQPKPRRVKWMQAQQKRFNDQLNALESDLADSFRLQT
jgi:hypothetical protein